MKKDVKAAVVNAGRVVLADWLRKAEAHGTIYYTIPRVSRSGMQREIRLYTVGDTRFDVDTIVKAWPTLPEADVRAILGQYPPHYNDALDVIAKDWGFSFKARSFIAHGCGMDMVFATVDYLARIAGMTGSYANNVNREQL